jgi:hypothetical protein
VAAEVVVAAVPVAVEGLVGIGIVVGGVTA